MKLVIDFSSTPLGHVVFTWLLVALCTFVFKKRTPEAYAASAARHPTWFWARATAFWQLAGGLGLDPVKVAEGLGKVITGRVLPVTTGSVPAPSMKDDESGPYRDGMLPVLLLCGALGAAPLVAGCSSPAPADPAAAKAQRQMTAAGTYTTDLEKCTVTPLYPTFAESKSCTANVRERWHRLPDGGTDPAFFIADGGVK